MRPAAIGLFALALGVGPRAGRGEPPVAEVRSGAQATTVHVPLSEPLPERAVDAKTASEWPCEGVGLAVDVAMSASPIAKTYTVTKATFDILLETTESSVDAKNQITDANLMVVDRDVGRLQELVDEGQGHGDEARRLAGALRARARQDDGTWTFLSKAVLSYEGLYAFDVALSTHLLEIALGEALSERLGVGERFMKGWQATKRPFPSRIRRAVWKKIGERARDVTVTLTASAVEAFLKAAVIARFDKEVEKAFHDAFGEVLARNPPSLSGGAPLGPELMPLVVTEYRRELTMMVPYAPRAVAAQPMAVVPELPMARTLTMPTAIAVPRDPMVRAVTVEDQVRHYQVQTSVEAYHPAPSPSPAPEPHTFGPVRIGGSWDGNGLSLWH